MALCLKLLSQMMGLSKNKYKLSSVILKIYYKYFNLNFFIELSSKNKYKLSSVILFLVQLIW